MMHNYWFSFWIIILIYIRLYPYRIAWKVVSSKFQKFNFLFFSNFLSQHLHHNTMINIIDFILVEKLLIVSQNVIQFIYFFNLKFLCISLLILDFLSYNQDKMKSSHIVIYLSLFHYFLKFVMLFEVLHLDLNFLCWIIMIFLFNLFCLVIQRLV